VFCSFDGKLKSSIKKMLGKGFFDVTLLKFGNPTEKLGENGVIEYLTEIVGGAPLLIVCQKFLGADWLWRSEGLI
jgi:hypothetical protein